ncbi:hypothetical protein J6524_03935 [Bradyrhizobium sp. WSM 1738]|uniref:hypothetical protein n=1 Tax=Bradyrhizobium hereditatis TaxID=2821405 RepID=UPI001CE25AB0|nr:hypothetical protein [Bradyrhizobium hereditatis]MCA6114080.1 hypothetical protein [Bradyrhizobium hereditatis]
MLRRNHTHPEIESLSDLNNKNIAIEEKQSASSGRVNAAFMAAGAAEVQFSEGQAGAIDRLIHGEVPAAVLTLASPQATEWSLRAQRSNPSVPESRLGLLRCARNDGKSRWLFEN